MKDITIPGGKDADKARKLMRVFSPLTGAEMQDEYPVAQSEEVQYAVEQAMAAFPVYAAMPGTRRELISWLPSGRRSSHWVMI